MSEDEKPHPLNAPEGFYVVNDCCTACDVPHSTAPELFDYDESLHCYVKRQPENEIELYKALQVTWFAELECVRYRGSDENTIRRMAEMGNAHLCDSPVPQSIKPIFRNHVTFQSSAETDLSPKQLAVEFKKWLLDDAYEYLHYSFKAIAVEPTQTSITFAWYENNFYTVNFSAFDDKSTWHIFQSASEAVGSRSVSRMLHDWLTQDSRFSNFRWYSESNWLKSAKWQKMPF
jgi:hypothetical protein